MTQSLGGASSPIRDCIDVVLVPVQNWLCCSEKVNRPDPIASFENARHTTVGV